MLGIGFGELTLVLLVLIVVLGPERLPTFMKTVGKGIRSLRQASRDIRSAVGIDELLNEDVRYRPPARRPAAPVNPPVARIGPEPPPQHGASTGGGPDQAVDAATLAATRQAPSQASPSSQSAQSESGTTGQSVTPGHGTSVHGTSVPRSAGPNLAPVAAAVARGSLPAGPTSTSASPSAALPVGTSASPSAALPVGASASPSAALPVGKSRGPTVRKED